MFWFRVTLYDMAGSTDPADRRLADVPTSPTSSTSWSPAWAWPADAPPSKPRVTAPASSSERAAVAGGTTSLAGGHFTRRRHRRPGGHRARRLDRGDGEVPDRGVGRPDPEKIHAYCQGSVEHFTWLEALGFSFERSYYPEKAVIQPQTQGLMYTGNEKVGCSGRHRGPCPAWSLRCPSPATPAARRWSSNYWSKKPPNSASRSGYETGAGQPVVDDEGRVAGWRAPEASGFIRAKSVIIAAGGFVSNSEMVAENVPKMAEKSYPLGTTYDDGLGLRMGSIGGRATARHGSDLRHRSHLSARQHGHGRDRQRRTVTDFVTEDSYHSRTSAFVMDQPDSAAFPSSTSHI